jgi:hypothetical protein
VFLTQIFILRFLGFAAACVVCLGHIDGSILSAVLELIDRKAAHHLNDKLRCEQF